MSEVYVVLCLDPEGTRVIDVFGDEEQANTWLSHFRAFANENEDYWYERADFHN